MRDERQYTNFKIYYSSVHELIFNFCMCKLFLLYEIYIKFSHNLLLVNELSPINVTYNCLINFIFLLFFKYSLHSVQYN